MTSYSILSQAENTPGVLCGFARQAFICIPLVALFLCSGGCSNDKPSQPDLPESSRLAGGGRSGDTDPFVGGPGDSGPVDSLPVVPGVDVQYYPVFYSQQGCAQNQQYQIITDQNNLNDWWQSAIDCEGSIDKGSLIPIPDSTQSDSGSVGPDSLWPGNAPEVDFASNAVVIIKLEQGIAARYLWISDISAGEAETQITYVVSSPGEDCFNALVDPNIFTTPIAAFIVPRPEVMTFGWSRVNTTYRCSWEPDPDLPLTLYYTDAPCPDLGATERLIRTRDDFRDWIESAWQCDRSRWGDVEDSLIIFPDSTHGGGGPDGPPHGIVDLVDFATHAVLILRANPQAAWGGGIWLDKIEAGQGGTLLNYTVMAPGSDCPTPGNGQFLRPTVAIRVKLPIAEPLIVTRNTQEISCNWPSDSTVVIPQ